MDRFRIDSINQMALKQIAAVQLSDGDGPFVLGRPDPALQGLAPDAHPLTPFLLRLMHDEPLEVETQNQIAALAVQVVHFGDIDPIVQHVYAVVLGEGRPQHVVTLKMNKMLRDVLHLAHAHQEDFQKVFSGADVAVGSATLAGGRSSEPAAPPKPALEKQKIIMVQDEPAASEPARWSPVRGQAVRQSPSAAPVAQTGGTTERVVTVEKTGLSPGMITLGVDLLIIPISIATGAHVGMTSNADDGWQTFFLVLLPSLVLVSFVGAICHWVWKYMQEEH